MADSNDGFLNPATGLPMVNGLDTSGNIIGCDGNQWLNSPADEDETPFRDLPLTHKLFVGGFAAVVLTTIAGGLISKALF